MTYRQRVLLRRICASEFEVSNGCRIIATGKGEWWLTDPKAAVIDGPYVFPELIARSLGARLPP